MTDPNSTPTNQAPSQIRVGAGLEESRLNRDFVDFLAKWSTPVLLVAAVVALGFVGYRKYHQSQLDTLDAAFRDLENATATLTPSPDSLAAVASQFEGVGAVSQIARLGAADSLMFSVQTGLKPGAELNNDGSVKNAEDVLTDADRTSLLNQAQAHYQSVLEGTQNNPAQRPLTFSALFGLAAVNESKGDTAAAKSLYERVIALVESDAPVKKDDGTEMARPFALHAAIAKKRIDNLANLASPVALLSEKQLPPLPELPKPALPPVIDMPTLPPGAVELNPAPTPAPEGAPASAPNPAPAPDAPATPETPATPPATPPANPK